MHPHDVDAVLRAEGSAPIAFPYRKDDYALHLLLLGIGGGRPISALRQGPLRRLLEKPIVRPALARASYGMLAPRHVEAAFDTPRDGTRAERPAPDTADTPRDDRGAELPTHVAANAPREVGTPMHVAATAEREVFSVTLARWGADEAREWGSRYFQMSRPGHNLVVQLNFPASHDHAYERLLGPEEDHPFVVGSHPVRKESPFTLAWARLDVDFDAGEVLVEEVQCDWVREARSTQRDAAAWLAADEPVCDFYLRGTAAGWLAYFDDVLAQYAAVWSECVLAAAIAFAYERLGLRRVYFHTFEGGNLMKRMRAKPPRSLYADLPERFCFVETKRAPAALRRDGRVKMRSPSFYVLELV